MPREDSDSSDGDGSIFTTTNVLLGYASKEPTDDIFSQLGGYPTWPDPESLPSADLAKCKVCTSMMGLLLQLNGDLPEKFPSHERRLYIFNCRNKACRKKHGSTRAIRGVKITKIANKIPEESNEPPSSEQPQQTQPPLNLGGSLFKSTFSPTPSQANPFSTTSNTGENKSTPVPNPFAPPPQAQTPQPQPQPPIDLSTTFAAKARISSPPTTQPPYQPFPAPSSLPKPYPAYHLDADYESLDPAPPSSTSAQKMDLDSGDNGKDDEKDAFESTIDKTFQRFADRLAQNPLQVLRYEYGGAPLLYSKDDVVGKHFSLTTSSSSTQNRKITTQFNAHKSGIAACPNCNSPRVFELQLVPHTIAELEAQEEGLEGMDWGTVILGVCGRDCGERDVGLGKWSWMEESVGVQWEAIRRVGEGFDMELKT